MVRKIAGMLVTTVVVLAVSACGGSKAPIQASTPPPPPLVQQLLDTIVQTTFAVPARAFKPIEVVVSAAMSNPRLEGSFTASGANNDIEVLLLDELQFNNWQNRLQFRAAYTSGRVTADKLRIELPSEPGKYFLVFSNRFSLFSTKSVNADLKLRYDRAF